jgi:hypothetical protein
VRRARPRAAPLLGAVLVAGACASLPKLPPPAVAESARKSASYSAALGVTLNGPELRARTRALVAFERPGRMRLEIPGPAGLRFVAIATEAGLLAVFPSEQAVFRSRATAAEMERLIGIALTPAEMMDALLGVAPSGVRSYEARWGPRLPLRVGTTLRDGTRLRLAIDAPEAGVSLPPDAFAEPPHAGYRTVDADEARRLWSR